MKRLIPIIALALTACTSTVQKNAGAFLSKAAQMHVSAAKVAQHTTGPFYNHTETLAGLSYQPGSFNVTDLSAEFNIPVPVLGVPLLHWDFTADAITGTDVQSIAALAQPATPPPPPK